MTRTHGAPSRSRRALIALTVLVGALFAVFSASALAVPGTQTWTGQPTGPTPDIERTDLRVFGPDGTAVSGVAGTLNFTLNGVARVGYCTDTSRPFSLGTRPVELTVQDPPASASDRAVTWILLNRIYTGAHTPEKADAAAAAQVAVWLLRGQVRATDPTDEPAINAAAFAIRDEALAATAVPAALALSVAPPAPGAGETTVTVTGRAGAVVTLSVVSGPGTLSAGTVTIGADGRATATLRRTGAGTVQVRATTAGDGRLIDIDPTDQDLQSTAIAEGTALEATAAGTFSATAAGGATPVAGAVAGAGTGPRAAALRIAKAGPRTGRALGIVRYTIVVRNTGRTAATRVVLRDRLPRGMSFVRSNVRSRIRGGAVVWQLGRLAPGARRRIVVSLRADATVRGPRTNVATVSAARVRPVSARATTRFRALVRRVQPAVTG